MAFLDKDENGAAFVNVTHQCGRIGPNNWDDLEVVQALLNLVYTHNPFLKRKKWHIEVTGKESAATNVAIADFQATFLKRPKPEGYINRATGQKQKKSFSTIWQLNMQAAKVLTLSGAGMTVIQWLIGGRPNLGPKLSENGDSPNVPDEPNKRPRRERSIDW